MPTGLHFGNRKGNIVCICKNCRLLTVKIFHLFFAAVSAPGNCMTEVILSYLGNSRHLVREGLWIWLDIEKVNADLETSCVDLFSV